MFHPKTENKFDSTVNSIIEQYWTIMWTILLKDISGQQSSLVFVNLQTAETWVCPGLLPLPLLFHRLCLTCLSLPGANESWSVETRVLPSSRKAALQVWVGHPWLIGNSVRARIRWCCFTVRRAYCQRNVFVLFCNALHNQRNTQRHTHQIDIFFCGVFSCGPLSAPWYHTVENVSNPHFTKQYRPVIWGWPPTTGLSTLITTRNA